MPPPISKEIKDTFVRLRSEGKPFEEARQGASADLCAGTARRWDLNLRRYGQPHPPSSDKPKGRPQSLDRDDKAYLIGLLKQNPTRNLENLCDQLWITRGVETVPATVSRTLARLGIVYKTVDSPVQREGLLRAVFKNNQASWSWERTAWVDARPRDDIALGRKSGWSLGGMPPNLDIPHANEKRWSFFPALSTLGMAWCEPLVVEGEVSRERFETWVRESLLPSMKHHNLQRLVLANCQNLHGAQLWELCEHFGVELEYIPDCCPDLNPLEKAFPAIQNYIRADREISTSEPEQYWWKAVGKVSPESCHTWIRDTGYEF